MATSVVIILSVPTGRPLSHTRRTRPLPFPTLLPTLTLPPPCPFLRCTNLIPLCVTQPHLPGLILPPYQLTSTLRYPVSPSRPLPAPTSAYPTLCHPALPSEPHLQLPYPAPHSPNTPTPSCVTLRHQPCLSPTLSSTHLAEHDSPQPHLPQLPPPTIFTPALLLPLCLLPSLLTLSCASLHVPHPAAPRPVWCPRLVTYGAPRVAGGMAQGSPCGAEGDAGDGGVAEERREGRL